MIPTWSNVEVHVVSRVQIPQPRQNIHYNLGQVAQTNSGRHEIPVHIFEDYQDFVPLLKCFDECDRPVQFGFGENAVELLQDFDFMPKQIAA